MGLVFFWGLEWGSQRFAFPQGGKRRWERASLKVSKVRETDRRAEREREREREREIERGAEGELGRQREGGRGCAQSSPGFSPEFHSSDA